MIDDDNDKKLRQKQAKLIRYRPQCQECGKRVNT